MAVTDKTDFRWNGKLAGAINNLYYDLINVDVVKPPYSPTHRNSSFFLKTRLGYRTNTLWNAYLALYAPSLGKLQVTDVKIVWDDSCTKTTGTVFVMAANSTYTKKYIARGHIEDGCLVGFFKRAPREEDASKCSDWKFFTTSFLREEVEGDLTELTGKGEPSGVSPSGIQINKYEYGRTVGLFSDADVETGYKRFSNISVGDYIYAYKSTNEEGSGFAGQIRMVTGFDDDGRITLDAPWLGFKTPDTSSFYDGESRLVKAGGISYRVFKSWGECVGFTTDYEVRVFTDGYSDDWETGYWGYITTYEQVGTNTTTKIISVTDANDKVFILTDNGYIHYSKSQGAMNKFFINEDMDAGADKTSLVAYKDFLLAFGRRRISVGVPDEQNIYWTMYNQSTTIGTWSRYSYAEYDGDLIFVSNDKRLLALGVSATAGRYMLQHEDVGDMLNGKLSTMIRSDEVYIGSDNNNLRVFVNTRDNPYSVSGNDDYATHNKGANTMTHIYKFDKLFKVWSEDHIDGDLLYGVKEGIYIGQSGLYVRDGYDDYTGNGTKDYKVKINAYLIENENNGLENKPDLFMLAKLNRLITTLGPGRYSSNSKIHITSYTSGIGVEYEFPLGTDDDTINNKWIYQISGEYVGGDIEIDDCQLNAVEDSNTVYNVKCSDRKLKPTTLVPDTPRCNSYKDFEIQDHGVCINDRLYRFAPTMPLVTSLGENQKYSTEIKLELISGGKDIICFGGWLAELFIAPLGYKGSDGEYELSPESSC